MTRLLKILGPLLCATIAGACASAPPPVVDLTPSRETARGTPPPGASENPPPARSPSPRLRAHVLERAGDDPPEAARAGTRTILGQGFHYDVPADWEDLDATTLGSPLIRTAQRSMTARAGFRQNVNIASEPYLGGGPDYGAANLVELIKVSTIRDQRPASVGARPGLDIEAYWPNAGGAPYITLQRYATNGSAGFVITCSTGESLFVEDRGPCDVILDSFRVD